MKYVNLSACMQAAQRDADAALRDYVVWYDTQTPHEFFYTQDNADNTLPDTKERKRWATVRPSLYKVAPLPPAPRRRFDPFPPVQSKYGAPMGRHGCCPADLQDAPRLHAKHQGGGDGYDKGGAYWGTPHDVWGVWARIDGETLCTYVRATSRLAAIAQVRTGEER